MHDYITRRLSKTLQNCNEWPTNDQRMKMSENKWKWVKMSENEWKWVKMSENEWKWMKMSENEWK